MAQKINRNAEFKDCFYAIILLLLLCYTTHEIILSGMNFPYEIVQNKNVPRVRSIAVVYRVVWNF